MYIWPIAYEGATVLLHLHKLSELELKGSASQWKYCGTLPVFVNCIAITILKSWHRINN